ncbi:unnamed protein product [Peniophora sp. CBMAI 1063]|nr:unnamed protein product [Peniophora sp. CBMAI 1063]
MSECTEPRFRVAICGGGIGGLTLALVLARIKDIAVDVYDQATDFNIEIGAGISLQSRNLRFLSTLGLKEDVVEISAKHSQGTMFSVCKADQGELKVAMETAGGGGAVSLHRAEFHNILFRHIPEHVGMHHNKRLVSYADPEDGSPIRLDFADSSSATCDILIGADGVKSAVRATLLEGLAARTGDVQKAERLRDGIAPRYSGVTVYRAAMSRDRLAQVGIAADGTVWTYAAKIYTGNNLALVIYPISQGLKLNVALYNIDFSQDGTFHPQPWVTEMKGDELIHRLDGWAEEPRKIVAGFNGMEAKKWVVNVLYPLEEWSSGRVTLLGDAAHAMTSFQGAGAGQAMEDALVLSTLFKDPRVTRETVHHAFRAYADVRRPVAKAFYEASRRNGELLSDASLSPGELASEFGKAIMAIWGSPEPENDAQQALEQFEKAIAA